MNKSFKIRIKRCRSAHDTPYFQTFLYDGPISATIADVLDYLNYNDDLFDENGNAAERIAWDCGCLQGACGGCAVVIDSSPALACEKKLSECKGDTITVEPLSKFPVIADLSVDRSAIFDRMLQNEMWQEGADVSEKKHDLLYLAAKCLKCGLCLEVCPNFALGGTFDGATLIAEAYTAHSQSTDKNKKGQIKRTYSKHFASGCSKSLACQNVCPAKLDLLSMICAMNKA